MYVDSDVLFALLKPNDRHYSFAAYVCALKDRFYCSAAALMEVEIVVKREISDYASQHVLEALKQKMPSLNIVSLDQKTFLKSQELRQQLGLGIFDSIHAATALAKDKRMASTDHIFDHVRGLECIRPPAFYSTSK
ncbi:MAG: PIN domain-containing protein [Candidatus Diapherotrites archaeon]|nr:PIN domain-containing protein [Candidatus Diapherotrites archaeon]